MRSRTTVCVAVTMVIPAGVALAACGGEDIAERIAENRIEAEGGGVVDVDFDDGAISVKTEDGEFSIKTDDDGNVSIEGSGIDDGGAFTVDSENGETVMETEDGRSVFTQGADLPEGFPDDIPVPAGIEILFAQSSETGQGSAYSVVATSERATADLVDEISAGLEANGFERQQLTETPDGTILLYQRDDYDVAATFSRDDGDGTGFQLTVIPAG